MNAVLVPSAEILRRLPPRADDGPSISGFPAMTHGQDCDAAAIVTIEHDVAAATELDELLAKSVRHLVDRPANLGMRTERPYSLANRADRALRSVPVLWREEGMEARNIAQCRRRPDDRRHWSGVGDRRLHIFARFQPGEPHVRFALCEVLPGRLILGPGGQRVLA